MSTIYRVELRLSDELVHYLDELLEAHYCDWEFEELLAVIAAVEVESGIWKRIRYQRRCEAMGDL